MNTNTHILTATDRIGTAKFIIRQLPDSVEKQQLITLLDDVCDHLFSAQTDFSNAQNQIIELTQSIYMPVLAAQMDFPQEDDYNAVREYVETRKTRDEIFKRYCNTHSRRELCERLSTEFGWIVSEKSYGQNIRRH
mgnify:CR=1 FL=1